jgi:hypothetical protein
MLKGSRVLKSGVPGCDRIGPGARIYVHLQVKEE